jgi:hypothetical protein
MKRSASKSAKDVSGDVISHAQALPILPVNGDQLKRGASSLIRTMTVGPGITPDLLTLQKFLQALAGLSRHATTVPSFTAGGELHPALKTYNLPTSPAFGLYATKPE